MARQEGEQSIRRRIAAAAAAAALGVCGESRPACLASDRGWEHGWSSESGLAASQGRQEEHAALPTHPGSPPPRLLRSIGRRTRLRELPIAPPLLASWPTAEALPDPSRSLPAHDNLADQHSRMCERAVAPEPITWATAHRRRQLGPAAGRLLSDLAGTLPLFDCSLGTIITRGKEMKKVNAPAPWGCGRPDSAPSQKKMKRTEGPYTGSRQVLGVQCE